MSRLTFVLSGHEVPSWSNCRNAEFGFCNFRVRWLGIAASAVDGTFHRLAQLESCSWNQLESGFWECECEILAVIMVKMNLKANGESHEVEVKSWFLVGSVLWCSEWTWDGRKAPQQLW